jgi:hypothetical protein
LIAAITLTWGHCVLCFLPSIAGERASHVIHFIEVTLLITAYEAFIATGIN